MEKERDTKARKRMTVWGFIEVFRDQLNISEYMWLVCGKKEMVSIKRRNGPSG